MPDPVAPAQANTEPAKTGTDVKPAAPLLSSANTTAQVTETKVVSEPAATVKVEAKADVKAEGDKDKEAKVEGAPEKYAFKETEGVKLDTESVGEFEKVARELNMSNDNAQKFVELASKHTQKIETQMRAAQDKAWTETREKWLSDLKADKDIGGANFDKNRELALRAVRFVAIPELNEVFDSGWGDHPALVKAFAKFGKALSEDTLVDGDSSKQPRTAAEIIYGKK